MWDTYKVFPSGHNMGLTVRDHIAIEAMNGLLCRGLVGTMLTTETAYQYADAMIEESNKE